MYSIIFNFIYDKINTNCWNLDSLIKQLALLLLLLLFTYLLFTIFIIVQYCT